MTGFTVATALGLVMGFLFGLGCAAAVLYTIFLSGYRAALRDTANGGTSKRYVQESQRLNRSERPN